MTTRSFWLISALAFVMVVVGLLTVKNELIALALPLMAYDKMVGVTVVPCTNERQKALEALRRYRATGNRRDLCNYYRYLALYYRCLYIRTRNRRYLCMYYAYAARYYLCLYQLTRNRRYYTYYRRYWDAYRRCR